MRGAYEGRSIALHSPPKKTYLTPKSRKLYLRQVGETFRGYLVLIFEHSRRGGGGGLGLEGPRVPGFQGVGLMGCKSA